MGWKDVALIAGILMIWFALNRWVLPAFGINTCMSGRCGVGSRPAVPHETAPEGNPPARSVPGAEPADGAS
jgi:hypothetical protein